MRLDRERPVGRRRSKRARADLLGLGQRDVGDALGVQVEHAEVVPLVDQVDDAREEQQLEAEEGVEHADGELARPSPASAASQITITFSRPKMRPLAARCRMPTFCTRTPALVWSTTRFW